MTGSAKYSPDGKGGYIGSMGSAPGVGDTIVYTPNRIGAGGGLPGVGDTIEYSPDGKGGYIGTCPGISKGLWYWISNGSSPRTWPTGTDPGWRKIRLFEDWNGFRVKFKLDKFWGLGTPHLTWLEAAGEYDYKLIHYYQIATGFGNPEGPWYQEEIPLPAGYQVSPYDYSMDIGPDGSVYIAAIMKGPEVTYENFDVKLYVFKKASSNDPPDPENWSMAELFTVKRSQVMYPPSIKTYPWGTLARLVFNDLGYIYTEPEDVGIGVFEMRELSDMVWSSPEVIRPYTGHSSGQYPKLAISDEGKSGVVMTDYLNTGSPYHTYIVNIEVYEKPAGGPWTRITQDPPGSPTAFWANRWTWNGQFVPIYYEYYETLFMTIFHMGGVPWDNTEGYLPVRESYVCVLNVSDDPDHSVEGSYEEDELKRPFYYYGAALASSLWRAGVYESYCHQYLICNRGVLDYTYFSASGETQWYHLNNISSGVRGDTIGMDGVGESTIYVYVPGVGYVGTHVPPRSHLVFYQGPARVPTIYL
ncbi:MAG: hypothetical protein WC489_07945 [Patescibacteria group bacterium]